MIDAELVAEFSRLGHDEQADALGTALGQCIVDELRQGHGLGQVPTGGNIVSMQVMQLLEPLLDELGPRLMAVAEPAARKAAEIVGPAIRKELDAKIPLFAAITGLVAGGMIVTGMILGKRYMKNAA